MQDKPILKVHNYDHKVFNSIASILENVNNLLLRFREKWSRAREREEAKRSKDKDREKEERKRSKEVDMMMLFEEDDGVVEEVEEES